MAPSFLTIPIDFGFEWPPRTDCWVPARKTCNSHVVMGSCLATRPSKESSYYRYSTRDTIEWHYSPVCFWGRHYASVSEYHTWDRRSAAKRMGGISSLWQNTVRALEIRAGGKPLIKNRRGERGLASTTFFKWKKEISPRRGIEPRSPAWQAGILTTILTRISYLKYRKKEKAFSQPLLVFHGKVILPN